MDYQINNRLDRINKIIGLYSFVSVLVILLDIVPLFLVGLTNLCSLKSEILIQPTIDNYIDVSFIKFVLPFSITIGSLLFLLTQVTHYETQSKFWSKTALLMLLSFAFLGTSPRRSGFHFSIDKNETKISPV